MKILTKCVISAAASFFLLSEMEFVLAAGSTVVEFDGLGSSEILSIKLGDDKQVQTGIAGQCDPIKERVLIEKNLDSLSQGLAEATAFGTVFDHVIVYRGNAQFWLYDAVITSYSISGGLGAPQESLELLVSDITPNPQ